MGFRETLRELCAQVEGALASAVIGSDGIPVDSHEVDASEANGLNAAMVECANLFDQVRQAAAHLEAGDASELSLRTEKLVAVGRAITPDYLVLLVLSPGGNSGKARFALRIAAPKLALELQ